MVGEPRRPRVLSPEHAKRSRLCDATRLARRDIARNRSRRPLLSIDNNVEQQNPRPINLLQSVNIMEQIENENNENVINQIYCENLEQEHEQSTECPILYVDGDYKQVEKYCLSISYRYPQCTRSITPSVAPLYFRKCLLHNLGDLNYACSFCDAICWKTEGKSVRNFVGKFCCSSGKVNLLPLDDPPAELKCLLQENISRCISFRQNIRAYNSALAFASLGAHVDNNLARARGVYTFKVHGSIYHNIGPLIPSDEHGQRPRFAQLYFFDTDHELDNRLHHVSDVDKNTLEMLQNMMHRCNPYARAFRFAATMMQTSNVPEVRMIINENRSNSWQYLAPRGSEVAAILPGQGNEHNVGHRDILIDFQNGGLKRISSLHRSYMSLLYVLLFPWGEDGWYPCLRNIENNNKFVTQKQYYSFRLQVRKDTIECLLRGGRLLQQFIVDAYSTMEESRLFWLRNNQTTLRAEVYQGLADMIVARDGNETLSGIDVGRRVILPSSFTGGPRYMVQLYQDAMAIVRGKGKPDLFITFTCNPQWKEIKNALLSGQKPSDRPDLTSRVFYQKFKDMMHLILKGAVFGDVIGHVSVIEFQKRGLPHAHILLILGSEHKPTDLSHYDKIVCAEFPDKQLFPELYDIIRRCNVHGPCGQFKPNSSCMVNGTCRFKYPRQFCTSTNIEKNSGYPTYMRRDNGSHVQVNNINLDNRWIVPYNPFLSLRYQAHINVEICSTITAVKYLYKYVYKGHDRATVIMQDRDGGADEIKKYLDARYVSASEAIWRIYGFDLHDEKPDVQRLQVHLPLQNTVTFGDSDDLANVVNNEANRKTTLTEWFVANQNYPDANNLLYIDFPTKWVYHKNNKCWMHRQMGNSIGRMYNIVPTAGDLYYLRMLLTICKGCKSFEDLRSFNGQLYATFKEACNARGLLQNDEEWYACLEESSLHQNAIQLRQLFVIILVFCEPLYPEILWERFSTSLSDDYSHTLQMRGLDANVCLDIAKNQALANLEEILKQYDKTLSFFPNMPHVNRSMLFLAGNTLFAEETVFDAVEQNNVAMRMETSLNHGQRYAYDQVMQAVYRNEGGVFFLDGPGGSGKTYVYNTLLSKVRGNEKIALACASSGIAALLLNNGRTAHQRFKIPLDLHSESTCNIKVNSVHAELLRLAILIVWDEAPMTHRYAFEALDRTLRDIMHEDKLFGGKTMLFGGDFRQVLPVVPKGSREDVVNASLCNSYIWSSTTVLHLTENMRILNCSNNGNEREFAKWILEIGNGNVHDGNKNDNVFLPCSMMLERHSIQGLIDWIYADIFRAVNFGSFFRERAILAPRNKDVDVINALAVCNMRGQCKEYYSADTVCVEDDHNHLLYTTEYLNSLDLGGGFPPHILYLKENAPIILLRNLDPKRGLCNGTRLICKQLHHRVIEATIITGQHAGDVVLLPRIDFVTSNSLGLPFQMRRRQFPVKLAFAMTINKAQGQTIGILGLYLASPVFSHGQLYVAISRVRSAATIKILIDEKMVESSGGSTQNIVFKEVLQVANGEH